MTVETLLIWIIVGAIAGFLASLVIGSRQGLIGDIVVGVVGGLLGGFLFNLLGIGGAVTGFNLGSTLVAFVGACILLLLMRGLRISRV